MAATLLPSAELQFCDSNGNPLAGGKVYFYIPNTTTPKNTWQDPQQTILNPNPVVLDAAGRAIIWGAGTYRQQVYDANGNLIYDAVTDTPMSAAALENTLGAGGAALIGFDGTTLDQQFLSRVNRVVSSIAALRSLSHTTYNCAFVTGYYTAHDGGGGAYQYDPADTTSADNGATIIVAADGGRWKLQLTGALSLKQCGAKGDGTTDDTAAVNAWIAIIMSGAGPKTGYAPAATYHVTQQITMDFGPVATTGATFIGDGRAQSIFELKSVTTAPAWIVTDTVGTKAEFYAKIIGIGFQGNVAGPVLQLGDEAFAVALNEGQFDVAAWNSNTTANAVAIECNGLYNCDSFLVANCAGHGKALRARQCEFSRFFGSMGNADTGLHLTGGYNFGNVFTSLDLEVVNTCVVIDGTNVSNNTFIGGQFVWTNGSGPAVAAITATAGNNNRFIGVNFASPGTVASSATGIIVYGSGAPIGSEYLGGLVISPPSGDGALTINSVTGNSDDIVMQQNGVSRWMWQRDTSANVNLVRFNSSGVMVDLPLSIEPTQGVCTINNLALKAITNATATSASGGGASGLPSAPAGYLTFTLGTSPTIYKLPFYNT